VIIDTENKKTIYGEGLLQRWPPMAANIIVAYLTSSDNFNYIGMICVSISVTNVTLLLF